VHRADIQTFVEESVDMYAIAEPPWFVQAGPRADTKRWPQWVIDLIRVRGEKQDTAFVRYQVIQSTENSLDTAWCKSKIRRYHLQLKKSSFTAPITSHWRPWNLASAFLVSLCVLAFLDLGRGLILLSPTSLPASDRFDGKLVGVTGAGAPNSCAGELNGLAAGELVCARRLGNVPVTGVETVLPGALNGNEPAPVPVLVPVPTGGWPNGGLVDDGAAPKGGALPNALFEATGGGPNMNGVLERPGS